MKRNKKEVMTEEMFHLDKKRGIFIDSFSLAKILGLTHQEIRRKIDIRVKGKGFYQPHYKGNNKYTPNGVTQVCYKVFPEVLRTIRYTNEIYIKMLELEERRALEASLNNNIDANN